MQLDFICLYTDSSCLNYHKMVILQADRLVARLDEDVLII